MPALREVFAEFGFQFDEAALKKGHDSVNGLVHGIEAAAAAFAGGAIVHGLNDIAEQLGTLQVLSVQTKINVTDLQALELASSQAGGSAEEMGNALTLLQRSLAHIEQGTSPQVTAFKKLGVATTDANGNTRSLNDLLPDVFSNFGNLTSDADRAAVATSLFGRSGVRMIPVLEQGKDGLAKMRAELEAVGGGATPEATEAAHEYEAGLHRLDFAFMSIKGLIATQVFPTMERMVETATHAVVAFKNWAQHTTLVENGAKMLALTLGLTLAKALAPYLKSGLKFAAIFLAIDDLLAFMDGKKSVIGGIIQAWFGPDKLAAAHKWVDDTKAAFNDFFNETGTAGSSWADKLGAVIREALIKPLEEFIHKITHPFESAGDWAKNVQNTADAAKQSGVKKEPVPERHWWQKLNPFTASGDFATQNAPPKGFTASSSAKAIEAGDQAVAAKRLADAVVESLNYGTRINPTTGKPLAAATPQAVTVNLHVDARGATGDDANKIAAATSGATKDAVNGALRQAHQALVARTE